MIELKGMTWNHARGYQPLDASVPLAKEKFGIDVTWERRSLKDFGDVPIDQLADTYDLLIIDHPHVGLAASTNCLLPLDEYLDKATLEILAVQSAGQSHQSYEYEDHQWALAIDTATQVSVYRSDLMYSLPPRAWDNVIAFGQSLRLTANHNNEDLYIAIPLCPTDAMCSFLSLNASLRLTPQVDGKPFDKRTGEQALRILQQLREVAHPESVHWNPIQLLDYMSEQNDVVYCPLTFGYTNYAREGYRSHRLRFHDIPNIKGALLGGTGFAVSSRCQYPEEAVAYGVWLCGAEVQSTFYVQQGGQPGNRIAWEDESANALTGNFFTDTLQTLKEAYLRPRHHGFVTFQEQVGIIIHQFLLEKSSLIDCLTELDTLYERYSEI